MAQVAVGFWQQGLTSEPGFDFSDASVIYAKPDGSTAHASIGWFMIDNTWSETIDGEVVASGFVYFKVSNLNEYYNGDIQLQQMELDEVTASAGPPAISLGACEIVSQTDNGTVFVTLYRFSVSNLLSGFGYQPWRAFAPPGDYADRQITSSPFTVNDETAEYTV